MAGGYFTDVLLSRLILDRASWDASSTVIRIRDLRITAIELEIYAPFWQMYHMIRRICIYIYKRTKFRELKSEYRCFVMSIVIANRNDDNLNFEIGDSIRKFLKIQWNNWIRNISSNSIIILFYYYIIFYYYI